MITDILENILAVIIAVALIHVETGFDEEVKAVAEQYVTLLIVCEYFYTTQNRARSAQAQGESLFMYVYFLYMAGYGESP